jgi:transposase InsO family protein
MGIRDKPIAPGSPWQNGFAERLIGTLRRDCVDHMIVLSEAHLRRILTKYAAYYNELRTPSHPGGQPGYHFASPAGQSFRRRFEARGEQHRRDPTAWLGWKDSNQEMSARAMLLKFTTTPVG